MFGWNKAKTELDIQHEVFIDGEDKKLPTRIRIRESFRIRGRFRIWIPIPKENHMSYLRLVYQNQENEPDPYKY